MMNTTCPADNLDRITHTAATPRISRVPPAFNALPAGGPRSQRQLRVIVAVLLGLAGTTASASMTEFFEHRSEIAAEVEAATVLGLHHLALVARRGERPLVDKLVLTRDSAPEFTSDGAALGPRQTGTRDLNATKTPK
jgi:hypothetical protein